MAVNGQWCLIESDPGVFSELIKEFGCNGLQVEELWSLDESAFSDLKPIYGLIFLFKWKGENEEQGKVLFGDTEVFFAKQVINNACATQAIISVLLNIQNPEIKIGDTLTQFKDFTSAFDPALKGMSLTNADRLREVHNSFARQNMFEFDSKIPEKDDDVYHFVAFVPFKGRVYELDGLKPGPIDHGSYTEDWISVVRPILQSRIAKHAATEITFNLMAVVGDKLLDLQKQLEGVAGEEAAVAEVKEKIRVEEEKRANYKIENIRRKHNYLPLIMEMLKILSEKGMLLPLTLKAKEKIAAKDAPKKESSMS